MTRSLDSRILKALRSSPVHLPIGELAELVGSGAAAVRQRLAELRAAGYEISEQPLLGCRLVSAPDRLIADDLMAMLDGCQLVRDIIVLEETGSTNNVITQLGSTGAGQGLVAFAETQSAGRGRLGRAWESASRQGLWFSLLLRPRYPLPEWTRLTTWAAVGVAMGIESVTGRKTSIKWPNDVFIDGKKAVGILIESHAGMEEFAVTGIGVNVNQLEFPASISKTATSLRIAEGRPFDRQEVAVAILRELDRWSRKLESGFSEIVAAAEERSYLRGRCVEMQSGSDAISGIAGELDETGALCVRKSNGECVVIGSGEVTVAGWDDV